MTGCGWVRRGWCPTSQNRDVGHPARCWLRTGILKARPAEYRAALSGPEGHGCLHAALRTMGSRFRAHANAAVAALRLAWLAALGVVLKPFVVKKELFAGGKDEFSFAIHTLQYSIRIFHGRFSVQGNRSETGHSHVSANSVSLSCLLLDCNRHVWRKCGSEAWLSGGDYAQSQASESKIALQGFGSHQRA